MKRATACVVAALLLAGCNVPPSEEEVGGVPPASESVEVVEPSLMTLPDGLSLGGEFRGDPYIHAAVRLQGLGRKDATKALADLARQESPRHGHRAIILCRMLFARKAGGEFRRPMIGAAQFSGGTDYADWPLEPIEVVDGVPFLIVGGYILEGVPELGEWYLDHCLAECDWTGFRYATKTAAQKEKSLDELIRSDKWKEPLDDDFRDFLAKQVKLRAVASRRERQVMLIR